MATAAIGRPATAAPRAVTRATGESRAVRWTLIGIALAFLALVLLLPLALVFVQAFAKGLPAWRSWDAGVDGWGDGVLRGNTLFWPPG